MILGMIRLLKTRPWARWLALFLLAAGIVAILAFLARHEKPAPHDSRSEAQNTNRGFEDSIGVEQYSNVGKAVTTRSEERSKLLADRIAELQRALQQALGNMKHMQETNDRELADLREQLRKLLAQQSADDGSGPNQEGRKEAPQAESSPARIRKIAVSTADVPKPHSVHIPAGTFVKARALTGVFAPLQGSALPVLLKLESIGCGPNRSRLPIREALVLGKAQGDGNSARAIVQLQTLSLVLEDGQTVEVSINGFCADSDGIQGIAGKYVYRASEIIGLAALAKGLSTGSDALSARNVTSTVNPLGGVQNVLSGDALEFGGLQVVSGALDELSKVIAKRADQIQPAIYVANGREITVVFLQGVDLPGFQITESSVSRYPYKGLDAHR